MSECKHGSLARSCEICERDAEINRLRAELKDLRSMDSHATLTIDRLHADLAAKDAEIKRVTEMMNGFDFDCEELRAENKDLRSLDAHAEKTIGRLRSHLASKDAKIKRLESRGIHDMQWELAEKDKRIEELEEAYKEVTKTIHYPPGCGKHIITDEQIDTAWEYAHGHLFDSEVEICVQTLAKLGIDTERWRQCDPYREERGDE